MNNKIIEDMKAIPGLRLECPSCQKKFKFDSATIFDCRDGLPDEALHLFATIRANFIEQRIDISQKEVEIIERRKALEEDLKKAPKVTLAKTAGINFGQMVENVVPSFKAFPYNPKDCRQMFDPIDYVVFQGLSKGRVESITFADVKTGSSRLNTHQKDIKKIIEEGKISFSVIGGSK